MMMPTDALGTPVCCSTCVAAASTLARNSGVICAEAAAGREQQRRAGRNHGRATRRIVRRTPGVVKLLGRFYRRSPPAVSASSGAIEHPDSGQILADDPQ